MDRSVIVAHQAGDGHGIRRSAGSFLSHFSTGEVVNSYKLFLTSTEGLRSSGMYGGCGAAKLGAYGRGDMGDCAMVSGRAGT